MITISRILTAATVAVVGFAALPAVADYPERPVRLIIPFGQGGATDTVGRMIATPLEQALGQSVIVSNQPGAGGAVGIAAMARARPDGYTLAMGANDSLSTRPLVTESGYTLDSIEPIAMVAGGPIGIAVASSSPYHTTEDLAEAMSSGANINFGSPGVATGPHLAAELFVRAVGGEATHVPSASVGEAMVRLLSGEVQFVAGTGSNFPARIGEEEGGIRVLGLMSEERWERLPDVPTFREQGHDLVMTQWFGIVGPRGMPEDVVARLAGEIETIMTSPDAEGLLANFHFSNFFMGPEEFGPAMRRESEMLLPLLQELGMARD